MQGSATEQMKNDLRIKLRKLFLHCVFITPEQLNAEFIEHLDIPKENFSLYPERSITDDDGSVLSKLYSLRVYNIKFSLKYDARLIEPKEIEVPKIIKKPRKWWQLTPKTEVVVEKKKSYFKPTTHWILNAID